MSDKSGKNLRTVQVKMVEETNYRNEDTGRVPAHDTKGLGRYLIDKDNAVICFCDGTAKEVLNCLNNALQFVVRGGQNTGNFLPIDTRACAGGGIDRISKK